MIILIAGGSCSGKTFISEKIKNKYPESSIIRQDWYYKNKIWDSPAELELRDALDMELLRAHLSELMNKSHCASPVYDFISSSRLEEKRHIKLQPLLVIEGLYSFIIEDICSAFKRPLLKLYISAPENMMVQRRVDRDTIRKKKSPTAIEKNFSRVVLPAFRKYVKQQKSQADIILNNSTQTLPDLSDLWKWLEKHSLEE